MEEILMDVKLIKAENEKMMEKIENMIEENFNTIDDNWSKINKFYTNESLDELSEEINDLDLLNNMLSQKLIQFIKTSRSVNLVSINEDDTLNNELNMLIAAINYQPNLANIDSFYNRVCYNFMNQLHKNLNSIKLITCGFLNQSYPRVIDTRFLDDENSIRFKYVESVMQISYIKDRFEDLKNLLLSINCNYS